MSSSFHACAIRASAALLAVFAIFNACAVLALTVDDLDPSTHWKVGTISFSGNHIFADGDLQGVMHTKPRPFYTPWKARPEFDPAGFTGDLKRLGTFYQANGYYH